MNRARKRALWRLVGVIAVVALVAAACGDDDQPATPVVTSIVTQTSIVTETSIVEVEGPTVTSIVEVEVTQPPMMPGDLGAIAFSFGNESAGIYPVVANPARIEAERRGYNFLEGSANGDCDQQVRDLENFIAQGVVGITFLPLCGVDPYRNVVQQMKDAGIVVVGYSTAIPGGDAAIIYDNATGGQDLALEAIRWYNEDFTGDKATFSWGLFTFDQCGRACTDRTDTIRKVMTDALGVAPVEAEAVAEDTGLTATETWLQADPGLNMVLGINDGGALGAYQAFVNQIEQEGRDPGEIFVGGMDGQNEALELIAAGGGVGGIYRASAALLLDQLGQAVADLPINIYEGQPTNSILLVYALITPADPARAQEILDTYNQFVG